MDAMLHEKSLYYGMCKEMNRFRVAGIQPTNSKLCFSYVILVPHSYPKWMMKKLINFRCSMNRLAHKNDKFLETELWFAVMVFGCGARKKECSRLWRLKSIAHSMYPSAQILWHDKQTRPIIANWMPFFYFASFHFIDWRTSSKAPKVCRFN